MYMVSMRRFCSLVLILCLIIGALGIAYAATQSIDVEAGKEFIYKINVESGDRVQLTYITTGQASSNLSLSIVFPNATVMNLGEVDQYSSSFVSDATGVCELHFDNTNSSEAELVSLYYDVQHYIIGIPEMIFVLAAIVVLVMVFVGGYMLMSKITC
jgi:hypothetical protein